MNEVLWVQKSGGLVLNINREGIGPANPDEEEQGELMKPYFYDSISWPTVGEENIKSLNKFVLPFCEKFSEQAAQQ